VREGESLNIVAPPKIGKTFFVNNLALAIATGTKWMDEFECRDGKVLILDNELHEITASYRMGLISEKMEIPDEYLEKIHMRCLRGTNTDIEKLGEILNMARFINPRVVILDALYRFFPQKFNENDNADWTRMYNTIDNYMRFFPQAAFIIIHHTSKGLQGDKEVTDVGGGGGAQSRAADTHSVLRKHEEESHYCFEAECRTWKAQRMVIKFEFPLWVKTMLDPDNIKRAARNKKKRVDLKLTNEEFSQILNVDSWLTKKQIIHNMTVKYKIEVSKDAELAYLDVCSQNDLLDMSINDPPKTNQYFRAEFWNRSLRFQRVD